VNEVLFTAVLALAWFGAVNLALSAVAAVLAWFIERGGIRLPATSAPSVLLGLKLLPGVAALLFTTVVFLPAHWRFEPEGAEETAGYTLGAFAALGAITLIAAGVRGLRAWRLTGAVERSWQLRAVGPRRFAAGTVPVYCLPDNTPIISLAGLRHPRVFMARPVIDAFSADELDVSLAHELAHCDARDNLKRVLVACSPDLLSLWPSGRAVERRWRAAVEFAADARAVNGSDVRAVSLASALLKVARLAPPLGAASAGSGFYDGTLLWARIDRLLAPAESPRSPRPIRVSLRVFVGGVTGVAAVFAAEGAWLGVHLITEGLVRLLP
jgi:hypothetical protein